MREAVDAGWIGEVVFFPDEQTPYVAFRTNECIVEPWTGFWLRAEVEVELLWPTIDSLASAPEGTGTPIAWSMWEDGEVELPPLPPASP
jgi:hypothetical protein